VSRWKKFINVLGNFVQIERKFSIINELHKKDVTLHHLNFYDVWNITYLRF